MYQRAATTEVAEAWTIISPEEIKLEPELPKLLHTNNNILQCTIIEYTIKYATVIVYDNE